MSEPSPTDRSPVHAGQPARLRELGYDEIWLQNWLATDPTRLGLGEVTILAQELTSPRGGSLDILAASADGDTYYSVEVQLGEIDASHGFRVFDYWAMNRARSPGKTHIAVLMAESASGRFRPALEALAEYLPLLVTELRVWRGAGEAIIVPETVIANESLDIAGPAGHLGQERTRDDWIAEASDEAWRFVEEFVEWTEQHLGEVRVDYSPQSYIGVRRGRRVWAPLWLRVDGAMVYLPDPDGSREEQPSVAFEYFVEQLRESALEPGWQRTYNAGANPIAIRLRRADLGKERFRNSSAPALRSSKAGWELFPSGIRSVPPRLLLLARINVTSTSRPSRSGTRGYPGLDSHPCIARGRTDPNVINETAIPRLVECCRDDSPAEPSWFRVLACESSEFHRSDRSKRDGSQPRRLCAASLTDHLAIAAVVPPADDETEVVDCQESRVKTRRSIAYCSTRSGTLLTRPGLTFVPRESRVRRRWCRRSRTMPPLTATSRFLTQSKEDLSLAYVRAVAAAADCFVEQRQRDVHGIDGTIYQYNSAGLFPSQGLEFQAKCTHIDVALAEQVIYDLPVANYNRLRSNSSTFPAILILLVVPSDVAAWVDHSEERLLIRRCAYWVDYRGLPRSNNTTTKRVRLRRDDRFGVSELVAIMDLVTNDQF